MVTTGTSNLRPLDYAIRPSHVGKQVRTTLLGLAVIGLIVWGLHARRHIQHLAYVSTLWQCLNHRASTGRVVYEEDARVIDGAVTCWRPRYAPGGKGAVVFLHERIGPTGGRRLVMVQIEREPTRTVRVRAAAFKFDRWSGGFGEDGAGTCTTFQSELPGFSSDRTWIRTGRIRVFGGQVDARDPARFTFEYEIDGVRRVAHGLLETDAQVTCGNAPPDSVVFGATPPQESRPFVDDPFGLP